MCIYLLLYIVSQIDSTKKRRHWICIYNCFVAKTNTMPCGFKIATATSLYIYIVLYSSTLMNIRWIALLKKDINWPKTYLKCVMCACKCIKMLIQSKQQCYHRYIIQPKILCKWGKYILCNCTLRFWPLTTKNGSSIIC